MGTKLRKGSTRIPKTGKYSARKAREVDAKPGFWEKGGIDGGNLDALDVVYRKQLNDYLCTEVSVWMLMNYWDLEPEWPSRIESSGFPEFEDQDEYLRRFGVVHHVGHRSPSFLRSLASKGFPLLVRVDPDDQDHGHTVLMVGGSPRGVLYHDPYFGKGDGAYSWMSDGTYRAIRTRRSDKVILFVPSGVAGPKL